MCDCETTVEGWSSIESCRLSCPQRRFLEASNPFTSEESQALALTVTPAEARNLMKDIEGMKFLAQHKIHVYVVRNAGFIIMKDDTKIVADQIMVRASDDYKVGLGVGFLTALYEGFEKSS